MNNVTNDPGELTIPTDAEVSRTTAEMVEIIIYTICLCIGGPLNVISFYKIFRNIKQARSGNLNAARSTSQITLLRLHLNIADLLTMFVYTTSQIIWMLTFQWYGGDLLCRICKFFHTFSFYLNSFVIACIAIDRVFGTYNLSTLKASQRTYARCKKMLTVAWILAFLFSLPQFFVFRVFEPPGRENFKQCTPLWTVLLNGVLEEIAKDPSMKSGSSYEYRLIEEKAHRIHFWERIYNVTHLLFVFWIPALIIVASYITVMCLLNSFAPSKKDPRWKRTILEWFFGEWTVRKNSPANSSIHAPTASPRPSIADPTMMAPQQPLLVSIRPEHSPQLPSPGKKCRGMSYGNFKDPLFSSNIDNRSMSATSLKIDFTPRRSSAATRNMGPFALQTISRARALAKRQAALIIVAYLSFWTPYNLSAVILSLTDEGVVKDVFYITLPFLNSLLVVNPIVNPLIYGLFDRS